MTAQNMFCRKVGKTDVASKKYSFINTYLPAFLGDTCPAPWVGVYGLNGCNYMTFWKRQKYGVSKKLIVFQSFRGGMNRRNTEHF